jgi:hypothetical protein
MLKVHLGGKNGDMSLDVTEQNRCRIAQGSWRIRIPLGMTGYEGLLPLAFRENLLATLMAIEHISRRRALRSPQAAQVRPTLLT